MQDDDIPRRRAGNEPLEDPLRRGRDAIDRPARPRDYHMPLSRRGAHDKTGLHSHRRAKHCRAHSDGFFDDPVRFAQFPFPVSRAAEHRQVVVTQAVIGHDMTFGVHPGKQIRTAAGILAHHKKCRTDLEFAQGIEDGARGVARRAVIEGEGVAVGGAVLRAGAHRPPEGAGG